MNEYHLCVKKPTKYINNFSLVVVREEERGMACTKRQILGWTTISKETKIQENRSHVR
jgi:hypothetical protein